jgi:hypothetical protein
VGKANKYLNDYNYRRSTKTVSRNFKCGN